MKILITGAYGFIGKNLICELKNKGYHDLCFCGRDTKIEELDKYTESCDFVFHLAGVTGQSILRNLWKEILTLRRNFLAC